METETAALPIELHKIPFVVVGHWRTGSEKRTVAAERAQSRPGKAIEMLEETLLLRAVQRIACCHYAALALGRLDAVGTA